MQCRKKRVIVGDEAWVTGNMKDQVMLIIFAGSARRRSEVEMRPRFHRNINFSFSPRLRQGQQRQIQREAVFNNRSTLSDFYSSKGKGKVFENINYTIRAIIRSTEMEGTETDSQLSRLCDAAVMFLR